MKKLIIFFPFLLAVVAVNAQRGTIELNVYGGYTFTDRVDLYDTYGYVKEGFQYGGGLEYYVDPYSSMEIKYVRMDTRVPLYRYNNLGEQLNSDKDGASISYVLLGSTYYVGHSESRALPFMYGGLGVGIASAKNGGSSTKFGCEVKLGVKIKTNSAVSLKLHAYLQSMVGGYGGGFYTGIGGIVTNGVAYSYVSLVQFGLGGAVSFDFGHKHK